MFSRFKWSKTMDSTERRKSSAPPIVTTIPIIQNGASSASKPRSHEDTIRSHLASSSRPWLKDAKRPDFTERVNASIAKTESLINAHKRKDQPTRSVSLGNNISKHNSNGLFKKESSPTIIETPPTPLQKKPFSDFNDEMRALSDYHSGKKIISTRANLRTVFWIFWLEIEAWGRCCWWPHFFWQRYEEFMIGDRRKKCRFA